jgi:Xaa-Pro aminopeptidase
VIISPNTPYAVSLIIGSHRYVVLPSYIEECKAVKNPVELQGMRTAYIRDAVAMIRWLAWLDQKFSSGYEISEWEASDRLNTFRENELKEEDEQAMYMGPAYENIVASGPNGALPHYSPNKSESRAMSKNELILVDAGGQYRDGTCDTSRTVHFGYPTVEQAESFTRVLQGHIAIDTAIFPAGTSGATLDILARKALWRDKLNYRHGTGHGVGSFLTVHEGPHSFSSSTPLVPGHVITNEPGFYKDGEFGVRIESALVVRELAHDKQDENGKPQQWFGFERLTMVPIQTKMVRASLLSKDERQWIKDHNLLVKKTLEPYLEGDKRALKWLRKECQKTFGNEGKGSAGLAIEWD